MPEMCNDRQFLKMDIRTSAVKLLSSEKNTSTWVIREIND